MQVLIRLLLLFAILLVPLANPSGAQAPEAQAPEAPAASSHFDKRKLLVPPRNADGSVITTAFTTDPVQWMKDKQRDFYGAMSKSLRQIRSTSPAAAAWSLLLISFAYGVFHAAGPGHGKAVITSWLLATENDLRRGLLIALMSALIQALTAIVVVTGLFLFVESASAAARNVAGILESASFAMIGLLGLYLVWTAVTPFFAKAHHHDHGHHHVHDENCGHAHAPLPQDVKGDWSFGKALSLSFAVGIRPCTGAILVLIFAKSMGLYWAGIASTLAMALGVFLTIAAIATLAVYAKSFALKLAKSDTARLANLLRLLRLAGGLVIAGLGGLLFAGSLGSANAMM
jgi:nickel/cobalt transporter (NicO) family protein